MLFSSLLSVIFVFCSPFMPFGSGVFAVVVILTTMLIYLIDTRLSMLIHACNLSSWEDCDFWASLGYTTTLFSKQQMKEAKMAQQRRVLATKPDNLSWISGIHMWKETMIPASCPLISISTPWLVLGGIEFRAMYMLGEYSTENPHSPDPLSSMCTHC